MQKPQPKPKPKTPLKKGCVYVHRRTGNRVRVEKFSKTSVIYVTLPMLVEWLVGRPGFEKNYKPEEPCP